MSIRYLIVVLFFCSSPLFAQTAALKSLKYCTTEASVGTGTFDPVSYFQSEGPKTGNSSLQHIHDGVTYYFTSDTNLQLFKKDPSRYLPQFGGWCSMTLAMGKTTRPTYTNYLIQDGKLYLFERTLSVNGKELWLKSPKLNYENARKNYNLLLK
jgi:YHS domain-containing protein